MDEILDEKTYETRKVEYAGFMQRMGAFVLDVILLVMISIGIYKVFTDASGYLAFIQKYWIPIVLTFSFYFIYFDGSEKNATPGKQVMNIRLLNEEKRDIDYSTSAKHFFFSLILFLGFFRLLTKDEHQTMADKQCKVIAINRG